MAQIRLEAIELQFITEDSLRNVACKVALALRVISHNVIEPDHAQRIHILLYAVGKSARILVEAGWRSRVEFYPQVRFREVDLNPRVSVRLAHNIDIAYFVILSRLKTVYYARCDSGIAQQDDHRAREIFAMTFAHIEEKIYKRIGFGCAAQIECVAVILNEVALNCLSLIEASGRILSYTSGEFCNPGVHLRQLQIPVFAMRGSRGGWQLDEGWRTQVPGLDEAELRAFLMAQPQVVGDERLALLPARQPRRLDERIRIAAKAPQRPDQQIGDHDGRHGRKGDRRHLDRARNGDLVPQIVGLEGLQHTI